MTMTAALFSLTVTARDQNPHWQADACDACHVEASPTAENSVLRAAPDDGLCLGCHTAASGSASRHRSTLPVTDDMKNRMPASLQMSLDDGRVVCETCHDLPAQCLSTRRNEQLTNPMFVRDGPFRQRSDSCYLCHDEKAYAKLNPHDQFSGQGKRRDKACLLCHTEIDAAGDEAINYLTFNVGNDLSKMCTGCHPVAPHPGATFSFSTAGSSDHLVVPSPAMRRRMEETAAANGTRLPLEPSTGRIFCATCHNPHDRSLPDYSAAVVNAGDSHRLRLKDICIACHDK